MKSGKPPYEVSVELRTFRKRLSMKKIVLSFMVFAVSLGVHSQERTIQGTVVSVNGEPVANAIVAEKGTFNETETDADGNFRLALQSENELLVTTFMMDPKTVLVGNPSEALSITMATNAELLEAVQLRKVREREGKYVNTATGRKKKRGVGYSVYDLQEAYISAGDTDMFEVFKKIPGVQVKGTTLLGQDPYVGFTKWGAINPPPALIVVDDVPVDQNMLSTINPSSIVDITFLKSLASTTIYGSLGGFGVIKITTKNSPYYKEEKLRENTALVKGNDYDEKVPMLSEWGIASSKSYWQVLNQTTQPDEALALYNDLKQQPENRNVPFYIDVADYFSRYGNLYAHTILSDLFNQAQGNARILKTIVFTLEEKQMYKPAIYVLEHTIEKYPGHIQLYRDLARLYAEVGRYNTAANLYKQMIYNTVPNVDFTPIEDIVFNEFRSLIAHHKNKIDYKTLPSEFMVAGFKKDVRIVLEYTNPQSEFEVQFVSPSKKYFTWQHTYFDNADLIAQEIEKGFALKEFILEDNDYGNWIVNVRQTNDAETATPTYLKYTIYKDYGTPQETKKVKVVDLSNHNSKVTLDRFFY